MGLLNVESPAEITFRQGDTPPMRARKLELFRRWLISRVETILNTISAQAEETVAVERFEFVRAWWTAAPAANQTLIIWPFPEQMTLRANFDQAVGFLGGVLSAPMVIQIYRNPVFTGVNVTGGDVIGTITIQLDGSFVFATTDSADIRFDVGETLAAKWPGSVDAGATAGAFVIYALFGWQATYRLLLAGDQQDDGNDVVLLYGDQQSGDDSLLVEGAE